MKLFKGALKKKEINKKVEYNVVEEALIQNIIPTDAVVYITKAVSNLPYKGVKFGLHGYTLSRVRFNPKIEKALKNTDKSLLFVDFDCYSERVLEKPRRTLTATHTFYMKGHDKNIWKLVITTFCSTHTVDRDHDSVLVDVCSTYCKGIVELNDFTCITPSKLDIPSIDNLHLKGKRHYDGYITRYSNNEEMDCPLPDDVEEIISESGVPDKSIKSIDLGEVDTTEYEEEINGSGKLAYMRIMNNLEKTPSKEAMKKAEERLKNFHSVK